MKAFQILFLTRLQISSVSLPHLPRAKLVQHAPRHHTLLYQAFLIHWHHACSFNSILCLSASFAADHLTHPLLCTTRTTHRLLPGLVTLPRAPHPIPPATTIIRKCLLIPLRRESRKAAALAQPQRVAPVTAQPTLRHLLRHSASILSLPLRLRQQHTPGHPELLAIGLQPLHLFQLRITLRARVRNQFFFPDLAAHPQTSRCRSQGSKTLALRACLHVHTLLAQLFVEHFRLVVRPYLTATSAIVIGERFVLEIPYCSRTPTLLHILLAFMTAPQMLMP